MVGVMGRESGGGRAVGRGVRWVAGVFLGTRMGRTHGNGRCEQNLEGRAEWGCYSWREVMMELGGQGRAGGRHKDDIIFMCGVQVPERFQKRGYLVCVGGGLVCGSRAHKQWLTQRE